MLTLWKKQDDLQFLNEVSCVPLQQGLRNLQKAFAFLLGRTSQVSQLQKEEPWRQRRVHSFCLQVEGWASVAGEMC
jgi:hypothetical protein